MSPHPSPRKRFLAICGPAVAIVLAYSFTFQSPLQRTLKAERSKLQKLAASAGRLHSHLTAEKLKHAEEEVQSLSEQLADSKQLGTYLVSRRAHLRTELLESSSPAMTMLETLTLLSQHGLECLDSSPVEALNSQLPKPLEKVAVLLGGNASNDAGMIQRREMRLVLRGRFQDIQSALREMQAAPLGVFTVSLEMEASDVDTNIRIWILTIAV